MSLIKLYTWPRAILFNMGFPLSCVMPRVYIKNVLYPLLGWGQAYPVTRNNLEEIAAERGVHIKLSSLLLRYIMQNTFFPIGDNKWLAKPVPGNWRIKRYPTKYHGKNIYLYTLIDSEDKIIDFVVLDTRDETSARTFFKNSITPEGIPIQIDAFLSSLRKE
ncbi:MAG: hypothetical protein LEGION0403_FIIPPAGN_00070 [Legionella sp.]|uniref:DDE-type integrase/transposase/recombinase n=1 Tax=Legionella sp. TaxID=459 RepID=UPI003D148B3F